MDSAFSRLLFLLMLWPLGCLPADFPELWDADGDGFGKDEDCAVDDVTIYPGAPDPYGDGFDQDCDGYDGVDSDGDGFVALDCAPEDPGIHPGAPDSAGDGIDQDCDQCPADAPEGAGDGIDQDCDGYPANEEVSPDILDCDDENSTVHPGSTEDCNGVDDDCDGEADNTLECDPWLCGEGTWGLLQIDPDTVFVDAGAPEFGDGSEEYPLRSIQAGLDAAAASGGKMVAVAEGVYSENIFMTWDHPGIHLAGRCADLVILDCSVLDPPDMPGGITYEHYFVLDEIHISGITIRDSPRAGIWLQGGFMTVSGTILEENQSSGIHADMSSEVTLTDVIIRDNGGDNWD